MVVWQSLLSYAILLVPLFHVCVEKTVLKELQNKDGFSLVLFIYFYFFNSILLETSSFHTRNLTMFEKLPFFLFCFSVVAKNNNYSKQMLKS